MAPPAEHPQQLRARADEVLELHESGELQAALDACDDLLARAGDDLTDPVVRESVFAAQFERALLLTELGELMEAADAYAAAAATPADLADPDQRHEVAMALLNRGICLDAVGSHGDAVATYDDLVDRFGAAADPVTRAQVVRGRVNRAVTLLNLDEPGRAAAEAAALEPELDGDDVLDGEQLAMTLRLRAAALQELGRPGDAADALAEVERCTADDPAVVAQVTAAQQERLALLDELGRTDEAVALRTRLRG